MVRLIGDILDEINEPLQSAYPNGLFYGFSVLHTRDDRTFPMTRTDVEEGKQISPNDNNGLVFYHRELAPQIVKPLEGAKGKNSYQLVVYNMRLVGVGYRPNITDSTDWNNSDIARQVMAILGQNSILSGTEVVGVTGRVITDKSTVLNTEFTGQTEFNHNVLRLIAFSIDYTIQQPQICFGGGSPSNPLTSYTLSNNTQAIDSGNPITPMESTVTGDVTRYVIDVNDTILTGLTLNSSTGEITGTPTVQGSFDVAALDKDNERVGVQTATITFSGGGWTPEELGSAVVGWWDLSPDGTIVETDCLISQVNGRQSGGENATQATSNRQPLLSLINTVRAGAWVTNNSLRVVLGSSVTQPFNIFMLAHVTIGASQGYMISTDAVQRIFYDNSFNRITFDFGALRSDGMTDQERAKVFGKPAIHEYIVDEANSEILIDGGASFTGSFAGSIGSEDLGVNINIGSFGDTGANTLSGLLGEIVIIEGALSSADQLNMQGYLANKWGTTSSLADSHPYKNSPP